MPFPRRKNQVLQDKIVLPVDLVAAASSATTMPLGTMDGPYELDLFELTVPGGFVANSSAYWVITLVDVTASVTLATWSTQTGQQGTLTTLVMAAATNGATVSGAKGAQLNVVLTPTGSPASLAAQSRFVAHLHQL